MVDSQHCVVDIILHVMVVYDASVESVIFLIVDNMTGSYIK